MGKRTHLLASTWGVTTSFLAAATREAPARNDGDKPEGSGQQSCRWCNAQMPAPWLPPAPTAQRPDLQGFGPSWGSLLRIKKAPCVFKEAPVGSPGGRKVKMISWC